MTLRTKVRIWLRQLIHAEEGINLVLMAGALTVLIGMAGVAVDGSNIYFQRQRMQIAADAAALGGARQLAINATLEAVDDEIRNLALANYADRVEWELTGSERGVDVVAYRTFEAFFARIMGYNEFTVNARSRAQYEPVTGVDGLFPLTLSCDCVDDEVIIPGSGGGGGGTEPEPEPTPDPRLPTGCDLYPIALHNTTVGSATPGTVLTDIYNGVQPGNFGWLTWVGSPSAPTLATSLMPPGDSDTYINPNDPNDFTITAGVDWVQGSPGVSNASDVRAALDALIDEERITVPVWDQATGTGNNSLYHVVGFASVHIESYQLPNENRITATYLGPATCGVNSPTSGTALLNDGTSSSYTIEYVGRTGNTWTYRVTEELGSSNLNHWLLGSETCLNNVVTSNPTASLGVDGSTGVPGIKWNTPDNFSSGLFSFTLNGDFPPGTVQALAKSGSSHATVDMVGPICDGTNTGGGSGSGNGPKVCLPTIDFETDAAGAALTAGQVIDTEWAAWGVRVNSNNQASFPATIFDSAAPTGGDTDLGSTNESYGGPGVGNGGRNTAPGKNSVPLGKVLIVQENAGGVPDDNAAGGTLTFNFNYGVNIDDVEIVDIDDYSGAGTVKAFSDAAGATLIATGKMLGLGDNSLQTVKLNAAGVRRLEISLPAGGAVASVVSCRSASPAAHKVGDLVWADINNNGLQDVGEPGIAGVEMELYASGLPQVVAKTVTNAGGQFGFENLPPGSYEIAVAAANFGAGKPLEGASYAPRDAGNDAADSDFNSATNKATVVVGSADLLTLDAGFRLPEAEPIVEGPIEGTINLTHKKGSSQYAIRFLGKSNSNLTWTYRVSEVSGKDLSHWNLGMENCLSEITGHSPASGYSAGTDGSTGFVGVKWDVAEGFSAGEFSVTLSADYPIGTVQALAKAATESASVPIAGPDCREQVALPAPTPEDTPNPDPEIMPTPEPQPTDPPNACVFHWVDWNGGASTELELKNAIENVSVSGVWKVNQVIPAGPDVGPSLVVEAALDGRTGQTVKIPLARYDGSGYSICGFANVKLVDYSLDEEDTWVVLQFLKKLVRSVDTDPAADDYGARDVRFFGD